MKYKKLENQPLKVAIAEFGFSPVMAIAEYIPSISENLRKKYPTLTTVHDQNIQFKPDGIDLTSLTRWQFITADKKHGIDINHERLVYFTADYPRFNGFSESCEEALSVLSDIVEPTLISKIGLRFSDLIILEDSYKMVDLVNSSFITSEVVKNIGKQRRHVTETHVETGEGNLLIRSIYGEHNLTCMPDLQVLPIAIKKENDISERMVLDFDHGWSSNDIATEFELGFILKKLSALHEISRESFWELTTDEAREKVWSQ